MLSKEQLEQLNTKRLMSVLKSARVAHACLYCSCCNEYYGDPKDLKQAKDYYELVKATLDSREHVERVVIKRRSVNKHTLVRLGNV